MAKVAVTITMYFDVDESEDIVGDDSLYIDLDYREVQLIRTRNLNHTLLAAKLDGWETERVETLDAGNS